MKGNMVFLPCIIRLKCSIRCIYYPPSLIIKDNDKMIAYALVMTRESKDLIPVLKPMFEKFEEVK